MKSNPQPDPTLGEIMHQLERKGISVRTAAARIGVNRAHLTRVIAGERPGSRTLIESLAALADTTRGRRPQEDRARLIGAAVRMFFVKRGKFQSEIWTGDPPPRSRN